VGWALNSSRVQNKTKKVVVVVVYMTLSKDKIVEIVRKACKVEVRNAVELRREGRKTGKWLVTMDETDSIEDFEWKEIHFEVKEWVEGKVRM
jgi:hypothetical protein